MDFEVFLALTSAGVAEAKARSAATAIRKEISTGIVEAQRGLATKADLSELKSELKADISEVRVEMAQLKSTVFERLSDIQKSMMSTVFGCFGLLAVLVTVLKYMG